MQQVIQTERVLPALLTLARRFALSPKADRRVASGPRFPAPAAIRRPSCSRYPGFAARLPRATAFLVLAEVFLVPVALSFAPPATAQPSVKLVSTTGQADFGSGGFNRDSAQAFTTGSNATGYYLTRVDLEISHQSPFTQQYTVAIHSDSAGSPGSSLGTLTNPSSLPSSFALTQFTASGAGIELDANTQYWVVFDATVGGSATEFRLTNSDAEDADASTGWSIADSRLWRNQTDTTWKTNDRSWQIAVHGYHPTVLPPPPSAPSAAALVGNDRQSSTNLTDFTRDIAQAFTTGSNAQGYKLTRVLLALKGGGTFQYNVTIRSDSSGVPGASKGTLTKPADFAGDDPFPAPGDGIDLDANTKCWVVIDSVTAQARGTIVGTNSDEEDAGKAAGWSIANVAKRRAAILATAWVDHPPGWSLKMVIDGYAKGSRPGFYGAGGLVSNTGQAGDDRDFADRFQAFTTGSNAGGYRLTRVDIAMHIPSAAHSYSVAIQSDSAGSPGTVLGTLTNPASAPPTGRVLVQFRAPGDGIDLAPGTTYWVAFDHQGGLSLGTVGAESAAEDAGAAFGWSIADSSQVQGQDGSPAPMKIAIHGEKRDDSPAKPAAPTVSKTDGRNLTVSWAAPPNTAPPVSDYDLRYRRKGDTAWTEHDHSGTATTATISGVLQGASWEAQVRATNSVGTGAWSDAGAGHTGPARVVSATTNRSGRTVIIKFTKHLQEGGRGLDARSNHFVEVDGSLATLLNSAGVVFAIGDLLGIDIATPVQTGQTVRTKYNVHTTALAMAARVTDADGLNVADFGWVNVTNTVPAAASAPAKPTAPTVTQVTGKRALTVAWTAPADNGSAIADYDLRYFKGSADPGTPGDWVEAGEAGGHDHVGTELTATITGLDASSAYRVQVRAGNAEGEGAWSDSGSATTGAGASPPASPASPTVSAVTNTRNLSVTWTAPNDGGSAITDYDLRYYAGSADPADEADWVTEDTTSGLSSTDSTAVTRTISGLKASTAYRVQVRAGNAEGDGAWSTSDTATTNAATSVTNIAPSRAELQNVGSVFQCVSTTATGPFATRDVVAGQFVRVGPLADTSKCGNVANRKAPMFLDWDGDTLTFRTWVADLPDNVLLFPGSPAISLTGADDVSGLPGVVFLAGAAARERTSVTVRVEATDPHGASITGDVVFQVGAFTSNTKTPSLAAPASRQFAPNAPIEPFVLPAATGGDWTFTGVGGSYNFRYIYEVTGLPPGLKFDASTRKVSGTPTKAGSWTVTYTADDADDAWAGKDSATAADKADTASRTFTIRVGKLPRIHWIRIVSSPTYDANGDGTNDTYVRGDRIFIDVEFGRNQPVAIGGAETVKLRLDMGADDTDLTNSQKVLTLDLANRIFADEVLRFVHTVEAADSDGDGVWVQPESATSKQVLFLEGTTTLTHADTGVPADLTFGELRMTGDPRAKVDGTKTSADTGPRPTAATVNGDTLTLTYNRDLAALGKAALKALREDFVLQGAGGAESGIRGAAQHPKTITMSTTTLTLTLSVPARPGDTVIMSYTGSRLWDTSSPAKRAPRFRDLAVTNAMSGAAGPAPQRAAVSGTTLRVVFDGALDATSTPAGSRFEVATSDGDGDRRYIPGTGTAAVAGDTVTVTLARAVRADEDASVSYWKPTANPLQGAATGNPAVRTFRYFHGVTVSDAEAPAPIGGGVVQTGTSPARSKMALHFSEALDESSTPAAGDFAVRVGATAVTVSRVAVAGNSVVLTLNRGAGTGATFQVAYTPGSNPIRDLAGKAAAGFSQTLRAAATGAPVLQTAVVEGNRIALTYNKPLDPESVPAAGAFELHDPLAHGERTSYTYQARTVTVEGRTAVLRLGFPIFPCEGGTPFTVSYRKPAASPLQGLDGTAARHAGQPGITYLAVRNARAGWCGVGWFDSAAVGSVIVRAKRPYATDIEPQPGWFTVTASGGPVTVTGAAYSADDAYELKLTLDRELAPDETVTVSYTRPEGESGLWDETGHQLEDIVDRPVANTAVGAENRPATGAPTIAGTVRVGETLTASTDGIADEDGLAGAAYSFQWISKTGGTAAEIAGATASSYTLTAAEEGRRVWVRVTFTDDAGNAERLASTATEAVAAARRPLTASFAEVPARHDGSSAFTFELHFSEDFGGRLSYRALRDHALSAAGGRVTGARRQAQNRNRTWIIEVQPDSREAVTVTLSATTDCAADGAICTPDGRPLSNAPTVTVSGPPSNSPATGAPAITGTAQVGETLTASTAGIADADGLAGASFAYQWVANDGAGDTDIAGARGAGYTLTDDDVGRRLKVRVAFTDDAGNQESLTSAATGAVLPPPLTASFHGVPPEHDGKRLFRFELRFSDDFPGRFDYKVLRDQALQVSGGRTVDAKRSAPGRNDRWNVSVRPASYEDVTVTLPAGSVRTESGRTLSNTVSATVTGPALLSVADARAAEGEDAAVQFAVTLSRAAAQEVTVDYVTRDGTAVAGADYTRTRGTLTFAPGDTEKTVSVPILDDPIDEGEETFTLKLRNAQGAWILDDEATGTIENDDPMPKAWTARFGRTVAVHVVDAVEARLEGGSESWMQVGGHRLGGPPPDEQALARRLAPERDLWAAADGAAGDPTGQTLTFRDLLLGSAFHLVSNPEDGATGPRLSAWGRVATSGFDGKEDKVSLNGTVTTASLGVDGVWKRWLTGLVLAYSEGDGSFTHVDMPGGDLTSSLTSLHPYAAYDLSDRVRLWGVVGYGSGALRLSLEDRAPTDTDLTMTMGALGLRGTLLQPSQPGGLELALRSDVLWMGMDSAEVRDRHNPRRNLGATQAEASRLRLVLEGSRPVALAGGGMFVPSLEIGLRHDGGDAETGSGVEVGGRLRYASAWGLSIEASVRTLLAHEATGYREWGAGGALRFDPGRQGRGLTASVTPVWGTAASGVQRLWGQQGAAGLVPAGAQAPTAAAGSLQAELGYGLAALNGRGLLTPYARVALTEGADQAWHLGTRLALAESLNLSVEASRRARQGAPTAHDLALLATLGW